jgi:hypothetical protein
LPISQAVGNSIDLGTGYTDTKENKNFLIYKEIQMGSGAMSYMRDGFLYIYGNAQIFSPYIYEEVVSHI